MMDHLSVNLEGIFLACASACVASAERGSPLTARLSPHPQPTAVPVALLRSSPLKTTTRPPGGSLAGRVVES